MLTCNRHYLSVKRCHVERSLDGDDATSAAAADRDFPWAAAAAVRPACLHRAERWRLALFAREDETAPAAVAVAESAIHFHCEHCPIEHVSARLAADDDGDANDEDAVAAAAAVAAGDDDANEMAVATTASEAAAVAAAAASCRADDAMIADAVDYDAGDDSMDSLARR